MIIYLNDYTKLEEFNRYIKEAYKLQINTLIHFKLHSLFISMSALFSKQIVNSQPEREKREVVFFFIVLIYITITVRIVYQADLGETKYPIISEKLTLLHVTLFLLMLIVTELFVCLIVVEK
ncbi:MAG: hypothetical protein EXX96DRAFT_580488 [Benjaminiella poitrasii]|nr:MAG: hypothetical protein EXX96DRAFT_580488 [Benjaminiella poitrasii]